MSPFHVKRLESPSSPWKLEAAKFPLVKAVRGRFLNIFGLEAHDNWI